MRKHQLLFAALLLASVTSINAQFTFRIAGGYAGPGFINNENVLAPSIDPATPSIDALANLANINDSSKLNKPVHGSYGSGGNVSAGVGYMFNNIIGFDIGITYSHSNTISATDYRALPLFVPTQYITATINSFAYGITLAPSLVITGEKTGWKVYPYGRFGILLPVAGKLTDEVTVLSPQDLNVAADGWLGNRTDIKLVTTGQLSLGFGAAAGVAYKPFPFMNVFAEINGGYINVNAKSSSITEWNATVYNSNGTSTVTNDVPLRGTYRTQFTYVDQLTNTSNNAQYNSHYDPTKPKQDLRPTSPGSNLGFNVGLTFFLGKKTLMKDKGQDKPKS